jgi:hypothetical protein
MKYMIIETEGHTGRYDLAVGQLPFRNIVECTPELNILPRIRDCAETSDQLKPSCGKNVSNPLTSNRYTSTTADHYHSQRHSKACCGLLLMVAANRCADASSWPRAAPLNSMTHKLKTIRARDHVRARGWTATALIECVVPLVISPQPSPSLRPVHATTTAHSHYLPILSSHTLSPQPPYTSLEPPPTQRKTPLD